MTFPAELFKLGVSIVNDWIGHHPHDNLITLKNHGKDVDLIVRELAKTKLPFGQDHLSIEVVVSPQDKLNGVKVEAKGPHCEDCRKECCKKLTDIIAKTYR